MPRGPKAAKNYTAIKHKFMLWLVSDDEERWPITQRLFAQENELDEATLSKWKQDPAFTAKVNELVDKHLADEYAPIAVALKRLAKRGSFNHQKLYLEMIGKYKETRKEEHSGSLNINVIRDEHPGLK